MSRLRGRRLGIGLAALTVLVAGGFVAVGSLRSRGLSRTGDIPTTRVKRGSLELKVYTNGELRPARSAMLVAPPVAGTLQIVRLAPTGTRVAQGDVVVEFDPSEQEYNLEQNRFDLNGAEQDIAKSKASTAVQVAEDQVALLKAKFDVRRAELEVLRSELVGAIDAKKNLLTLEEARRHLAQLEQDVHSREASNQAALAVLEEKRNKAKLAMDQAQRFIDNMTLRAPLGGVVGVKENPDASGGFFFPGMVLPEFREGDLVNPGRFIAEVLDVDQMEIVAKVSESDRSNVNAGQAVAVHVDALPGREFRGKVKNVAGMASRSFFSGDPMRQFDASFQIEAPAATAGEPRLSLSELRPGVTAQVIIQGDQLRDALYLPRQALFEKDSKPIVYLKSGSRFEAREVTLKNRTESLVIVEGIHEGDEVALVNPDDKSKKPSKSAAGPVGVSGGAR